MLRSFPHYIFHVGSFLCSLGRILATLRKFVILVTVPLKYATIIQIPLFYK